MYPNRIRRTIKVAAAGMFIAAILWSFIRPLRIVIAPHSYSPTLLRLSNAQASLQIFWAGEDRSGEANDEFRVGFAAKRVKEEPTEFWMWSRDFVEFQESAAYRQLGFYLPLVPMTIAFVSLWVIPKWLLGRATTKDLLREILHPSAGGIIQNWFRVLRRAFVGALIIAACVLAMAWSGIPSLLDASGHLSLPRPGITLVLGDPKSILPFNMSIIYAGASNLGTFREPALYSAHWANEEETHELGLLLGWRHIVGYRTTARPWEDAAIPNSIEFCGFSLERHIEDRSAAQIRSLIAIRDQVSKTRNRYVRDLFRMPSYLILIVSVGYPLVSLCRGPIRRAARRAEGRCTGCGYGLQRLTSDRCPECGMIVPPLPSGASRDCQ